MRIESLGWVGFALSLAACRQVLGIGDQPNPPPATDASTGTVADAAGGDAADAGDGAAVQTSAGGYHVTSEACARCLDTSCTAELLRCNASPLCDAHERCFFACDPGDVACHTGCPWGFIQTLGHPTADDAIMACRASKCGDACGIGCGGDSVFPSAACETCAGSSCCDEQRACLQSVECLEVSQECACGETAGCAQACQAQFEAGLSPNAAYTSCVSSSCATACTTGATFQCLDHPAPAPTARSVAPITVDIGFSDAEPPYAPFAGITIKACDKSDPTCKATAIDVQTTGADGRAILRIANPTNGGFDGYLDVSGGDVYPELVYLPFLPESTTWPNHWAFTQQEIVTFAQLALSGRPPLDPARGLVAATLYDCHMYYAPGVQVSVSTADSASSTCFLVNGLPDCSLSVTSSEATAFVTNVPPGLAKLTATLQATGQTIATRNIVVRAGVSTFVYAVPWP
jgi:hypothetical protein